MYRQQEPTNTSAQEGSVLAQSAPQSLLHVVKEVAD